MAETKRRMNLNAVPGHPDWFFGLILRHRDRSVDVPVHYHDERVGFTLHVDYDPDLMFAPYRERAQSVLDSLVDLVAESTPNPEARDGNAKGT